MDSKKGLTGDNLVAHSYRLETGVADHFELIIINVRSESDAYAYRCADPDCVEL